MLIGRTLGKFTQPQRNKSFDNFIVQGSLFYIAAESHPVQKAWGHKIVCTGVKFKSCFNVVETRTKRFLLLKRFRKSIVWPIYDVPFRSYWRKGQIFGSTGVKQVKMIQFCWQWSQNVPHVNTMKNQNSLPYVRYFVTMVTQKKMVSQWTLTFSLHNHVTETYATHSKLFWIWIVFTRRVFWDHCQQNWSIFTCLTPVEPKIWPLTFSSITTKRYVVDRSNYTVSESF